MNENQKSTLSGCAQVIVVVLILLWLGLAPVLIGVLNGTVADAWRASLRTAAAVGAQLIFAILPFALVALVTRNRAGWHTVAATSAGATALAGYIFLDASARALLPDAGNLQAVLRLALFLPYVLLGARWIPRLGGQPRGKMRTWLGLGSFDPATLWLSLFVTALLTLPWPITGALGDSFVSAGLLLQVTARVLPALFLVWGIVFRLLTVSYPRTWLGGLVTLLMATALPLGGILPHADWGALATVIFLFPVSFLLTELRARDGLLPLLPLATLTVVAPLLFIDPRDALAQGIPELQHLLAYAIVWGLAFLGGMALFVIRKLVQSQRDRAEQEARPSRRAKVLLTALAILCWSGWIIVYLVIGKPGFYNDGFLIIMEEQADLAPAYDIGDREERLRYVYETLVETAERTQAPVREALEARGLPYRPYYIMNMIRVDGHSWRMGAFQDQPGVDRVIPNPNVREYPYRIPIDIPQMGATQVVTETPGNLLAIGVDEVWDLGTTGEGIIVGGQDTGYDWDHPALKEHYRGWDGQSVDHDYSWHDAWDGTAEAFDSDSHGTHTMGTVLGGNGATNRIGVAPGATWIGCRNMRRGIGNPGSYAECMEFLLAPYPHGGDPFTDGDITRAAHVTNNSWGCPQIEGCFEGTLQTAVESVRAAGIMMVVSAGNEGPACGTANTPPANYDAVFSVGATNNSGQVVGFSSRGPVDSLLKPDISAPGSEVLSSVPGDGYGYASGTSMAGPHVAGVVALIWSANPDLIGNVGGTEALICETASARPVDTACTPEQAEIEGIMAQLDGPVCGCGSVTGVPNNVYGCGLIDAASAVREALGP